MGIVLLFAAALAVVIRLRIDENRYRQALSCAVAIVRHTERKIRLYGSPTEDILADFETDRGQAILSVGGTFRDAVAPVLTPLTGQESKIFSEFIDKLGTGYKEDALRLCAYTLSCLEERMEIVEKEHPARVRLYTAIPILSAASLLVLLL